MILLCDNRRRTESVFDFIRIDTVFSSIYLYLHSKNESGRYHCSSSYRFWFIYFPFGNVSKQDQEMKMHKLFLVVVKREMLLLYFSWNLLGASTSLYEYINYVVQKVNVLTHRNHVSLLITFITINTCPKNHWVEYLVVVFFVSNSLLICIVMCVGFEIIRIFRAFWLRPHAKWLNISKLTRA